MVHGEICVSIAKLTLTYYDTAKYGMQYAFASMSVNNLYPY